MTIRKVLLVDDDADIRTIGTMSLRNVGKWQVVVADSGAAAIEAVVRDKPDLVLLDVMMPGLDGPATLQRIRALSLEPPPIVVFLTAKSEAAELAHLVAIGAQGVIVKPFNPLMLPRQIRQLVETAS